MLKSAKQAGELIRKGAGHTEVEKTKINYADLVTKVDKECQALIEKYFFIYIYIIEI